MADGTLLCGVTLVRSSLDDTPVTRTIGLITGLTGIGASRRAIPNIHNDVADGWVTQLYSCIVMGKPFTVRVVSDTNDDDWDDQMLEAIADWIITWPPEDGFTDGGSITWRGCITDKTMGAADIEGRVEGDLTITPSGKPTLEAGTPVTP